MLWYWSFELLACGRSFPQSSIYFRIRSSIQLSNGHDLMARSGVCWVLCRLCSRPAAALCRTCCTTQTPATWRCASVGYDLLVAHELDQVDKHGGIALAVLHLLFLASSCFVLNPAFAQIVSGYGGLWVNVISYDSGTVVNLA
jgi:hypothetical protein